MIVVDIRFVSSDNLKKRIIVRRVGKWGLTLISYSSFRHVLAEQVLQPRSISRRYLNSLLIFQIEILQAAQLQGDLTLEKNQLA